MLANCTIFETEKDLLKLTCLSNRNDLWRMGFDLDDWDIGFCSDIELDQKYWWLGDRMNSYCCGYQVTEYNNKFYYMVYHS